MTKPIQPMMPLMHTAAALIKVQQTIIMTRTRPTFTPIAFASSSPIANTLKRQRISNRMTTPMSMGIAATYTSLMVSEAKLPINQ
jgi:hypothetical protein